MNTNLCLRCDDLFGSCKPLAGKPCAVGHVPAQIQSEPLPPTADEHLLFTPSRQMAAATAVQIDSAAPAERVVVFVKKMAMSEHGMRVLRSEVEKPVHLCAQVMPSQEADDETARRFEADWTSTAEQRKRKWLRGNGIVLDEGKA